MTVQELRDVLVQTAGLPADRPQTMPGAFYTDPAYFEWEKATVLRKGWYCLGRADEVPEPGDYFALQLLNEALLVARGDDGEIRVMANVCRHRGMPLVEGSGNAKRFVCSYHAWAYGRDGALLRAARMENAGFDRKTCKLPEFRSLVWRGFIYCALSDDVAPFVDENQELDDLIAPYETENMRLVFSGEEIWKTNWKCLVENFMEGYHLSVVHPQTLHGYTPTGLVKKAKAGPGFTSYYANYPQTIEHRGIGAKGLSEEERHRSTLFSVFPAQVTSQSANLLVSLCIFPLTVDQIRVKWIMSAYGEELDAETVQSRIALWTEVNREDREKLEKMQIALGSSKADAGPLATDDFEGTIRDFQGWLALQDQSFQENLTAAE